ncbi:AMP-binding protein [Pseudonocardia sp. DSM 110487]|uniref:(2,3-dihydroxybenzoyl)adenylate synthase n=1 Tax=Pseudonocardia sp. DSM 110487 TaxID=2865833 RepID=UPI001C69BCA0|nr:AMP-binding protein [Pseudonocardia sp. DSM 110487]QYN36933.1 AMP-binding protein [Pseudonocardia sp. DSM 110487]
MSIEPLPLGGVVPFPPETTATYIAEGYWHDQTLPELLFATAERYPDKLAVIDRDAQLSYAQLTDEILRLAAGLHDLGLSRGDRVVVHLPNTYEYIAFVFALWELGVVPVVAPIAHRRAEIEHFIDIAQARAYITVASDSGTDLAAMAADLKHRWPHLEHTVILDRRGGGAEYEALLSKGSLEHVRRCSPQDVALLQMSGGTTGVPKLMPHTHHTYGYALRRSVGERGITDRTVHLLVIPICHSMSTRSPGFLGAFSVGATIVIAPNGSPDAAFPLIEKHQVNRVSLVPPILLAWLNSSLRDAYDLSSLEVIMCGGAKLSEEVARRVEPEFGVQLSQSFGMGEGLVVSNPADVDRTTSVRYQGRPASEADEIRVVDDEGNDVPPGVPGHLLTRGPSVIRGYYRNPEQNALAFTTDGFYRTGDIVERDERGFIRVVGRSKDQINRGGEKIAPEELENALLAHRGVHNASVIGIDDEVLGERVKAYLIPRSPDSAADLTLGKLRRFLRERGLATFKLPDVVEVVDEFPYTAVGKVSKRLQRQP